MYVCICSSVTDNEIIDCSKDGCTFEEMKTKLCVSKNCGSCEMEALRIYKEYTDVARLKIPAQIVIKNKAEEIAVEIHFSHFNVEMLKFRT